MKHLRENVGAFFMPVWGIDMGNFQNLG